MNNIAMYATEFLFYSSVLLMVLGGIVFVVEKFVGMNEKAAIRLFSILLTVPLICALQYVLPDTAKISLPVPAVAEFPVENHAGSEQMYEDNLPGYLIQQLVTKKPVMKKSQTARAETIPVPVTHSESQSILPAIQWNWMTVFVGIWILISLYLLSKMTWMLIRLSVWSKQAQPVNDVLVLDLYKDCLAQSNIKNSPLLLTSESMPVPVTFGCFQPKIMLPQSFLAHASTDGLRYVLLHELEHLRRWDNFWHIVETTICSLFFFHPVVHWAKRNIHEKREHLCDLHVIQVTNKKFEYADFLLNEIWRCSQSAVPGIASAFASSPKTTRSRIHNILQKRNTTMLHKIRDYSFVSVVLLIVLSLPFFTIVQTELTDKEAVAVEGLKDLDDMNANPTDEKGVYGVASYFKVISKVILLDREKRELDPTYRGDELSPSQWKFDFDTNKLTVNIDVNDETQQLRVFGTYQVPWKWKVGEPLAKDGVRVLLNGREGKRGVDFDYNEEKATIWFLKASDCVDGTQYYISYKYVQDPTQPSVMRGGSVGNYDDRKEVRRFLGIPEERDPDFDPANSFGTNAGPVKPPYLYGLVQPMKEKGMQVGLKLRNKQSNDMHWLKNGVDYTYEEESGLITLKEPIGDEYIPDYVFVMGSRLGNNLMFHGGIQKGSVKVVLNEKCDNEKVLVEDEGFIVDYEQNMITVLDPLFEEEGSQIMVYSKGMNGSSNSYGNSCRNDHSVFDRDVDYHQAIHACAIPTDDPKVFKTLQLLDKKGLVVGVINSDDPNNPTYLKKDVDYSYNSLLREITLKKDTGIPTDKIILVAGGIPKLRHEFHLQAPIDPEKLEVYLGDDLLELGVGYSVDYETGDIEIYGEEIKDPYSKFLIKVGETKFDLYGNHKPKGITLELE